MRASWIITVVVVVVSAALVFAGPVPEQDSEVGGSKTLYAIKEWFTPIATYFKSIPAKTPSDIASDVKDKVSDVQDWARDNDAIQALRGALTPVKEWVKDRTDAMKDKTFNDMYESVKTSVQNMDDKIGTWLQEKTG